MLISATEEQFELVKRLRDLDHVKIDWGEELAKIPNETGKARIAYEYNGVTKAKIDMRKCTIAEQKQMQALLKKNGIECVFDPHEAGVICIENASKLANMEKVCAGNPLMPGTYNWVEAVGLTPVLRSEEVIPLDVEALNQKTSLHSRSERLKPFYDDKRIILKDLGRSNSNGYPLFEGVIDMSEYPAELQTQLGRELSYNYTLSVSNEPGKFKMQGTLEDFGLPRDMPLEEIEKINKPFDKEWLREASRNGRTIRLSDAPNKVVVFQNSLEENLAKMIHDGKLRFGEATVQARSGRWVKLSDAENVKGYRFEFPKPGQQNEEIASWLKLALENRGALNDGNVLTTVNNKVVEVVESKNANQIYKETFKSLDKKYEPAPRRNPEWLIDFKDMSGAEKSAGTAAESTAKVTEEAKNLNRLLQEGSSAGKAGEGARSAVGVAGKLGKAAKAVKNTGEAAKAAKGVGLVQKLFRAFVK